jgi:hypothetical protein
MILQSDTRVRIVSKISLSGGQGFIHCQCKKGNCKSGRCKCRRLKVVRARVSLCRIIGAHNMRKISKRLYATSAAVFDFNGCKILNLVKWSW